MLCHEQTKQRKQVQFYYVSKLYVCCFTLMAISFLVNIRQVIHLKQEMQLSLHVETDETVHRLCSDNIWSGSNG
jgi:hypothetical protein